MVRVFFGIPESYGNSPGKYWAFMGLSGKERRATRGVPKGGIPFLSRSRRRRKEEEGRRKEGGAAPFYSKLDQPMGGRGHP